jgi:hypothetical protein
MYVYREGGQGYYKTTEPRIIHGSPSKHSFMKLSCHIFNYALYHHSVWRRGGIGPPFLISVVGGGKWSASWPYRFTPGTHWIGGWVSRIRSRRCEVKKNLMPGVEPQPSSPQPFVVQTELSLTLSLMNEFASTEQYQAMLNGRKDGWH